MIGLASIRTRSKVFSSTQLDIRDSSVGCSLALTTLFENGDG
jgi:hypothetical protein